MNSVNPPSRVLRIVAEEHGDETEGGEATWKLPRQRQSVSLNASDCCFIKRKRNRFSDAERNRTGRIQH